MTLYRVLQGNVGFYIQPEMVKQYHELGYTIFKTVEIELTDEEVLDELSEIEKNQKQMQESIAVLRKE